MNPLAYTVGTFGDNEILMKDSSRELVLDALNRKRIEGVLHRYWVEIWMVTDNRWCCPDTWEYIGCEDANDFFLRYKPLA